MKTLKKIGAGIGTGIGFILGIIALCLGGLLSYPRTIWKVSSKMSEDFAKQLWD